MSTRIFHYTYSDVAKVPFNPVHVGPRASASFNYFGPDWNSQTNHACPNARKVQVRISGANRWLSVVRMIPACGILYVDPFVAGPTDVRWGGVGAQHFGRP